MASLKCGELPSRAAHFEHMRMYILCVLRSIPMYKLVCVCVYSGICYEQSPHKWLYIAGGCSRQVHFNDKRQIRFQIMLLAGTTVLMYIQVFCRSLINVLAHVVGIHGVRVLHCRSDAFIKTKQKYSHTVLGSL
jgi:hypothetical protein